MIKRIIYTTLLLVTANITFGQISISVLSEQNSNVQITTNDLLQFSLMSAEESSVNARLRIKIDSKSETVSILETSPFKVNPGFNSGQSILRQNTLFNSFAKNGFERSANRSFQYPPGTYSACIELLSTENIVIDRKCITLEVINIYQLLLIYPYDNETIDESNPTFSWTPIFAPGKRVTYRILWYEQPSDSKGQNVSNTVPFHVMDQHNSNIFPYSLSNPKFDRTKKYNWQVEAYLNNTLLTSSDVWTFGFSKNTRRKDSKQSYLDIRNCKSKNIHYFQGDQLGIQLDDFTGAHELRLKLINSENKIVLTEQDLDLTPLVDGKNYFIIDIKSVMNTNELHTLEVVDKRRNVIKSKVIRIN